MSLTFVEESVAILRRTPGVLDALLRDLPEVWTNANEGNGTWTPHAVVGHLIHAEENDWISRARMILEHGLSRTFEPFDREAQFRTGRQKPLPELLDQFAACRSNSLETLGDLRLTADQLRLEGSHPAFGAVSLRQLLATWTAHDLGHLLQISRVMARRYKAEVGPWAEYLSVMR